MTGEDFNYFCKLMRERSGLVLNDSKGYLVSGRLAPVARAAGLKDVEALLAALRKGASADLISQCVNAMATHESSFFRDGAPFDYLSTAVLPPLIAARRATRTLRVWCAACSSGQEPYSVAMALREAGAALAGWTLEIVATDMSEAILTKARSGLYSDFEVRRGLSPERLKRWFEPQGEAWRVAPSVRDLVTFRHHNLLQGAAALGVFDIIFCRNVLIYFDSDGKRQALKHLEGALAKDGALYLGSSETILGLTDSLESESGVRGMHRKSAFKPAIAARAAVR